MWWEGGVILPHLHHNIEHSIYQLLVVCVPMNNTFSLCPQVNHYYCVVSVHVLLVVISCPYTQPVPHNERERVIIVVHVFLV